jgi:hypothetical protein
MGTLCTIDDFINPVPQIANSLLNYTLVKKDKVLEQNRKMILVYFGEVLMYFLKSECVEQENGDFEVPLNLYFKDDAEYGDYRAITPLIVYAAGNEDEY